MQSLMILEELFKKIYVSSKMKKILGVLLMSIAVVGHVAGDSLPVETDTAYQKMVKTALVDTGNNYRLKTVIEKIKKGTENTISWL